MSEKNLQPARISQNEISLANFIPHKLSVLSNTVSRSIANIYAKKFGISISEWRVVAILHSYPGISSGEVSERSGMDAVAVSRAVSHLFRSKYISRKPSPKDKRKIVLDLSKKGQKLYSAVTPLALEYENFLLEKFTIKEYEKLVNLLDKLQERAN